MVMVWNSTSIVSAIGGDRAVVLSSSFVAEVKSDLMVSNNPLRYVATVLCFASTKGRKRYEP
jgi:ketol-acid reductoisomerase